MSLLQTSLPTITTIADEVPTIRRTTGVATAPTVATPCASGWWSIMGMSVMFAIFYNVMQWHADVSAIPHSREYNSLLTAQQCPRSQLSRLPASSPAQNETNDEDSCRKFIWSFLNGTTDMRDECEAFYDAFKAAECKGEHYHLVPVLDEILTNSTPDDHHDEKYLPSAECCENISQFYNRNCQNEGFDEFRLLGIVSVLVICGFMRSIIRLLPSLLWVPNAGVCIIVGAIAGGILRLVSSAVVEDRFAFDNDLFLQILLPPIIFEAAISIDKRAFRRDLFPILSFAILGTGLSAVAIGYITYALSGWFRSPSLPLLDSLLFGALMSSIDPVATLNILTSVGVSQTDTLYTLIFGESLLNDGVSIVLFESLVTHMGDKDVVDVATIHTTLVTFIVVVLGSMAVGVACGALCTLYFWALQGRQTPVAEVTFFFMWALIPYYIADGIQFSGIIAIMVMGFMMDFFVIGGFQSDEREWMEYMRLRHPVGSDEIHPVEPTTDRIKAALMQAFSGRGHIHTQSRRHVGFCAEVISSLMETSIFAYLGLFLFNEHHLNFSLISTGILACVTSRAGMVIGLSLLINLCVWVDLEGALGRAWRYIIQQREQIRLVDDESQYGDYYSTAKTYLTYRTQLILFSAGVRGAVSYALVQNIPVYNTLTRHGSHYKAELKAMTSSVIMMLLFSFGCLTYYSVQRDWTSTRTGAVASEGDHVTPLQQASMPLISDDENDEFSALDQVANIDSLEIEGRRPPPRPLHH